MVVKKYGNRRLYDTEASRYVTLEEVAERVRRGDDVQVIDARTGQDLTQVTLAQIILESRGAARLLPVPLLRQLIRMGDDALAEFFGRTMTWALDVYLLAKKGAQVLPVSPFAAMSLMNPFASLLGGGPLPWTMPRVEPGATPHAPSFEPEPPLEPAGEAAPRAPAEPAPEPPGPAEPKRDAPRADDIAELRRELEELKRAIGGAAPKKRR